MEDINNKLNLLPTKELVELIDATYFTERKPNVKRLGTRWFIIGKDGILEAVENKESKNKVQILHKWVKEDIPILMNEVYMTKVKSTEKIKVIYELIHALIQEKEMILVTHDGTFHADDVFAYSVLKAVFSNHQLIRSRDKSEWEKGDIVFDVGGGEFDHHGLDKTYRENKIPFASFGLIWKSYGKSYLEKLFGEYLNSNDIDEVVIEMDKSFIQAIDAEDNGINVVHNEAIKVNTISSIIDSFNNKSFKYQGLTNKDNDKIQMEAFIQASEMATTILENKIWGIINKISSREEIEKAFVTRTNKAVVVLEESANWEDTIWELDKNKEVLFVVYPKPDGYYMQVVRKDNTSFTARKDLPKAWGGKRDEELSEVIGIPDAIFCHTGLFLAGAKSKESIEKMVEIALGN